MTTLPVQLVVFINARHYRTFNLEEHSTFTVAHLTTSLAKDFCIPTEHIQFTRVSGLFIREHDSLYKLRASDGNHASLDVGLHESHSSSFLAGKTISFKYRENPQPEVLEGLSQDGIQEVDVNYHSRQPEYPTPVAEPSRARRDSSQGRLRLTREQKIALEDPFSITSRSCFEDDNEDDQEDGSDSESDVDDDLYSDDGEMPPAENRRMWPADLSQLKYEDLVALASITPIQHPKRETPMRSWLLRFNFQRKLHTEIRKICVKNATAKLAKEEDLKISATQPVQKPIADIESEQNDSNQSTLKAPKVKTEVDLTSHSITAAPASTELVLPTASKSHPVQDGSDKGLVTSTAAPVTAPTPTPTPAPVKIEQNEHPPSVRLHGLLLALQRTRAFVNAEAERRPNKVVMIQHRPGVLPYKAVSTEVNLRPIC